MIWRNKRNQREIIKVTNGIPNDYVKKHLKEWKLFYVQIKKKKTLTVKFIIEVEIECGTFYHYGNRCPNEKKVLNSNKK